LPNQFDHGWTDGDKDDRWQNKDHQWGNHLNGGFCCLFFGPLPAFRAEGVGMHPKSLGDAGAEAVGLNQCTNEGADIVNTGSVHQVSQGFGSRLPGAHFQIDQMEFVAQIGMGMMQVLAHSHEGLVERQAGFYANDCEVERVGQAEPAGESS
jgi:hypothetical protein